MRGATIIALALASGCTLSPFTPYTDPDVGAAPDAGVDGDASAVADSAATADGAGILDATGRTDAGLVDASRVDASPDSGSTDADPAADADPGDATPVDAALSPDAGELAGYVVIPAGDFMMGSPPTEMGRGLGEDPRHFVQITRRFWFKTTEVTQDEWMAVMGSNPSSFTTCGGTCPVENITWDEATTFLNTLSRNQGLTECYSTPGGSTPELSGLTCSGYRLPTEAEWEYAARAGTTGAFFAGSSVATIGLCPGDGNLHPVAWYCSNAVDTPHPVGTKGANPWGLFDIHGNVHEWVNDWLGTTYYAASPTADPMGPAPGANKVRRGGSFDNVPRLCRAASRLWAEPHVRSPQVGLRPARTVIP